MKSKTKPKKAPAPSSSAFTPSPEQDKALISIRDFLSTKSGSWYFTLAGYAGTGKTSLLQHLICNESRKFLIATPTGKAASVLRSKLPKQICVKTVHQLLYHPSSPSLSTMEKLQDELLQAKAEGSPIAEICLKIAEERDRLRKERVTFSIRPDSQLVPGAVVIVDEASMISRKVFKDLQETGCKVLFVGDPGQLPPVKDEGWFIEEKHDATLTSILRQAMDSPIVRLSMEIRNGDVNPGQYKTGDCILTTKDKMEEGEWLEASQVLTGSNASRIRINRYFRKRLGRAISQLPREGEKLICLKNDHYQLPEPWINGVLLKATADVLPTDNPVEETIQVDYEGIPSCFQFYPFHCLKHYNEGLEEEPREMRKGLFECDYAYAITVHKSQGSEWDSVIVADDQMLKDQKEFRRRWLYTAVTRAKKKLILVQ